MYIILYKFKGTDSKWEYHRIMEGKYYPSVQMYALKKEAEKDIEDFPNYNHFDYRVEKVGLYFDNTSEIEKL